jgi:hypothetical protein
MDIGLPVVEGMGVWVLRCWVVVCVPGARERYFGRDSASTHTIPLQTKSTAHPGDLEKRLSFSAFFSYQLSIDECPEI